MKSWYIFACTSSVPVRKTLYMLIPLRVVIYRTNCRPKKMELSWNVFLLFDKPAYGKYLKETITVRTILFDFSLSWSRQKRQIFGNPGEQHIQNVFDAICWKLLNRKLLISTAQSKRFLERTIKTKKLQFAIKLIAFTCSGRKTEKMIGIHPGEKRITNDAPMTGIREKNNVFV